MRLVWIVGVVLLSGCGSDKEPRLVDTKKVYLPDSVSIVRAQMTGHSHVRVSRDTIRLVAWEPDIGDSICIDGDCFTIRTTGERMVARQYAAEVLGGRR